MENKTDDGKNIAIIAYLTFIGAVIAILMNSDNKKEFASFHIRQALGIYLTWFILAYFVGSFDNWGVSSGFWIFIFILWLFGFLGALQNEKRTVPLIGDFFQKTFKSL